MGWTAPIEPIDITARITNDNAWHEVDLGSADDVPAGTKIVILRLRTGNFGGSFNFKVRPVGSSFDLTYYSQTYGAFVNFIAKLDANRKFEAKCSCTSFTCEILAYHNSDTLFIDPVNKSLTTYGSYQLQSDISLSATAQVIALEAVQTTTGYNNQAFRPYGATYDYYTRMCRYFGNAAIFCGVDASQQWEQKAQGGPIDAYLWGYLPDAEWVAADPIDIEPSQGSYVTVDLSSYVPDNAIAAIIQLISASQNGAQINVKHPDSVVSVTTNCAPYLLRTDVCAMNAAKEVKIYTSSNANSQIHLVGWLFYVPEVGRRTFPLPNPKTVWQSQSGKRTFPLPGEQVTT